MLENIFQQNIQFFEKYLKFNIDILKKIFYNNVVKFYEWMSKYEN